MSAVPRTRSSSVRRSLMTDFDIAKRRAAPVMEPASAVAEKAAMASSLSIVRFSRNLSGPIIGYRELNSATIVPGTTDRPRFSIGGFMLKHLVALAAAAFLVTPALARVETFPGTFHT